MGRKELDKFAGDVSTLLAQDLGLTRSIQELTKSNGRWDKDLSKTFSQKIPVSSIGDLELQETVEAALYLLRRKTAPIDKIEGDPAEKECAWATIRIGGSAKCAVNPPKIPLPGGASLALGVEAGGSTFWLQHGRYAQGDPGIGALVGLLRSPCVPYDLESVRSLAAGQVVQLRFDGKVAFSAKAQWSWTGLNSVEVADDKIISLKPLPVKVGASASLGFTGILSGGLSIAVRPAEDRGPGWVRVQLTKDRTSTKGLDLAVHLEAGVEPKQFGTWAADAVEGALAPTDSTLNNPAYKEFRKRLESTLADKAPGHLQADLKAAISRSRKIEHLIDVALNLGEVRGQDLYKGMLTGNFLGLSDPGNIQPTVAQLYECTLKETLTTTRTLALKINFLGFELQRDLKAWTQKQMTQGMDGVVWIKGEAGASLHQAMTDEVETMSFLVTLGAVAQNARTAGQWTENMTATLARKLRYDKADAVAKHFPQHRAIAEAYGLLEDAHQRGELDRMLHAAGPYQLEFTCSFTSKALQGVLQLPNQVEEADFRKWTWAQFALTLKRMEAQCQIDDQDHTVPYGALITPTNCKLIDNRPDYGFDPDGSLYNSGFKINGDQHFGNFNLMRAWLREMALAHYFMTALYKTHQAALQPSTGDLPEELLKSAGYLTRCMRDQVGSLWGSSLEAKYFMMPFLAGLENCGIAMVFERGTGSAAMRLSL